MSSPSPKKPSSSATSARSHWFDRAIEGDSEAVAQLLTLYRPLLLKIANRSIDASIKAKVGPSDIVQLTMASAARDFSAARFANQTSFAGWLVEILRNEVSTVYRRFCGTLKRDISRERPLFSSEAQEGLAQLSASLSEAGRDERHDRIQRVQAAMELLPQHYRLVLRLRYIEGLSFHEVAEVFERSYDGARMLHARALKALKMALSTNDSSSGAG